jgi:hypothetical protein
MNRYRRVSLALGDMQRKGKVEEDRARARNAMEAGRRLAGPAFRDRIAQVGGRTSPARSERMTITTRLWAS